MRERVRLESSCAQVDSVDLEKLGPQVAAERGLAARVRLHQSWYRFHVLGRARFGETAVSAGRRALGSILHVDDALAGLNFVTKEAMDVYTWRRRRGWGVDPQRCTRYLTSSQAMMLNVFGPLWADRQWARRTFSAVFDIQVTEILEFDVEFAPARRSEFLQDQTRLDLWMVLQTPSGAVGVVYEVKYSDRFNSRYIDPSKRRAYLNLADKVGLWDLSDPATSARGVNQLLRCHALGAAIWTSEYPRRPLPILALIHHPEDATALKVSSLYASVLLEPQLLVSLDLGVLVDQMEAAAARLSQREITQRLRTRYLDHGQSEPLWQLHRSGLTPGGQP